MALSPVELRHVSLPRGLLGYRRGATDRLLANAVDSFEAVWRERADLADKVEHLESELARHRELETLLRTTLVSAERTAHELKDQAKRDATLIIGEAHAEARAITRDATAKREWVLAETRRVQALLRSALQTLEESDAAGEPPSTPAPRALRSEEAAEFEAA